MGQRTVETKKGFVLDEYTMKMVYSSMPLSQLKKVCQSLRDSYEWYGNEHYVHMLRAAVSVVRLSDPNFETHYPIVN